MNVNRTLSLPHFGERPKHTVIDTIVIHSCYAPNAADPYLVEESCKLFDAHKVSPHYLIDRNGAIFQFVAEEAKAWHAGDSKLPFAHDPREQVNDFSIGIELIGDTTSPFLDAQYTALAQLIADIRTRHPIQHIVGHDEIAPGRKTDPGKLFNWKKIRS